MEAQLDFFAKTVITGPCVFCMLNPSKAAGVVKGKVVNDPTATRCIGFSARLGATGTLAEEAGAVFSDDGTYRYRLWRRRGGLWVVNLYAYCATDPKDLRRAWKNGVDVVGPENDRHIEEVARLALDGGRVVIAWGSNEMVDQRANHVMQILRGVGAPIYALRSTKTGYPEHPLYVPADVEMRRLF